jgi:hypothetical protein
VLFHALVANFQPFRPVALRDCHGTLFTSFFQHISLTGGAHC